MQQIFIIGDSISIQYGSYLEHMLKGSFIYARKEGVDEALSNLDYPTGANGGDSSMVRAYLREKCAEKNFQPDILVLNCGLHDIKTDPQSHRKQMDIKEYENNLKAILCMMAERRMKLVWIRTTPVEDDIHNSRQKGFSRYNRDVKAYNAVADRIFGQAQVPIIDLYSFTQTFGRDAYCDHVHFTERVQELQAAFIAGHLWRLFMPNLVQ